MCVGKPSVPGGPLIHCHRKRNSCLYKFMELAFELLVHLIRTQNRLPISFVWLCCRGRETSFQRFNPEQLETWRSAPDHLKGGPRFQRLILRLLKNWRLGYADDETPFRLFYQESRRRGKAPLTMWEGGTRGISISSNSPHHCQSAGAIEYLLASSTRFGAALIPSSLSSCDFLEHMASSGSVHSFR